MLPSRLPALIGCGFLVMLTTTDLAIAQRVRRLAGGGVQINAPYVRLNIGARVGARVNAPLIPSGRSVRGFLGRRRGVTTPEQQSLATQNQNTATPPEPTPAPPQPTPATGEQPTPVHVDDLPYPTTSQLISMDDQQLVETLRQMMARLHHRLSLLRTGEGWQKYLVLSREDLGSPGAPSTAADVEAIQKVLPRYTSVQTDSRYTKIANLPSFVATLAALLETEQRLDGVRPTKPASVTPRNETTPTLGPATGDPSATEVLPGPVPVKQPSAQRGERSILKRK